MFFVVAKSGDLMNSTGGILSYGNIQKSIQQDTQPLSAFEVPLYTDSYITGELDSPPYQVLNLVPFKQDNRYVVEALMLRVTWYINGERNFDIKTNNSFYHGGWVQDEISALLSLKLGIRLKAGGVVRDFGGFLSKDPLGSPRGNDNPIHPYCPSVNPVVPSIIKTVNIANALDFKKICQLSEEHYIAVIRSARMYQDALWMVEENTELAWLMIISALEVAANFWDKSNTSPLKKLQDSKPSLYQELYNCGGDELCEFVAGEISSSLGATNKFIKFCLKFLPAPPENRPREFAQVKWNKTGFRKILNKIYEYRSTALHGGIPFPAPLCRPPRKIEEGKPLSEKGSDGLASHSHGASWVSEDLPISANTFFIFAHGVLNNWLDTSFKEDIHEE